MLTETLTPRQVWNPGRRWNDGHLRPAMIDLPLGLFTMGEHPDDKFASDLERPKHRVEIAHPIAFGCFPVTVAEYAAFNGESFAQEESTLPVASVSWEDAVAYCDWLSSLTGHAYRLPSEAEWEYACGAAQGKPFPNGEVLTPADANYLYDEHGRRVGPGCRTPVGAYPPNAFGLYDMAGNVCEWVSDLWHPTFSGAPAEGESWDAGSETGLRVLRGGAWDYLPRLLRSSWRDYLHQQTRRDNVGFRVACATAGNDSNT
ncbi:MAG TPA: SUMF1/EgtB/PvdO family nonheme iron enzyme [Chthoniobacteraceae bacterium]|jgi:formylglycine-generating enzyme required for sulfatase activity